MKKIFTLSLLAIMALVGCKKEDKKTVRDYLTAKKWKPGTGSVNGTPDNFAACDLDNRLIFSKDGYLTEDVGSMKCDSDDQNSTFSYSLSSDEKTLTISASGQSLNWTIVSCTDEKLEFKFLDGTDLYEATYLAE